MDDQPTKLELIVDMSKLSLRDVLAIHQIMFDRLLLDEQQFALELAELLEDAANRYLDLSDDISARYQLRKQTNAQADSSNESGAAD